MKPYNKYDPATNKIPMASENIREESNKMRVVNKFEKRSNMKVYLWRDLEENGFIRQT